MTKFTIICPQCKAEFSAYESHIGRTGVCARCDAEFEIRPAPPRPLPGNDAEGSLVWHIGDVILDIYEVKQIHEGGGMGLVYRVHHRGWNVDLAVKNPRTDFFQTEQQKENFIHECETWINLGLHPHIVSCYYVRTLGGMPRVFAEYVEGGSLKDWIDSKRLYEGGEQEALKRILDIAIQMAWGLHYAHEKGLIHRDVKPANVLLSPDGTAKVADFGLAKARAATGETFVAGTGYSILVSTGGMTPAYCSPEQANKQPLSRRTDIWSWGLSVLEMFAGGIFWRAGQAAAEALENYGEQGGAEKTLPPIPVGLLELLKHCFQQRPENRPKNMCEVVASLQHIYRSCFGTNYPRVEPTPIPLLADSLNNRGVSMLDLERKEEAEKLFKGALKCDPHHPEATYNIGLIRWRSARTTDDALLRQLAEVRKTYGKDWRADFAIGLIHLERSDIESAMAVWAEAAKINSHPDFTAMVRQDRYFTRKAAMCVRTLAGHTDAVGSVTLSADNHWIVSGSEDKTLRLWDVGTGQCVRIFEGHTDGVNSVSLGLDGRLALSGSHDKTLRLWEVATGRSVRTFEGHMEAVSSVAMSADSRWALSGSEDKTLRLWEVGTGRCIRIFEGHKNAINAVSLSLDGCWALSGSRDYTLRLWKVATGRCVCTFEGHMNSVHCGTLSADNRWILSGSGDKTMRMWAVNTGRCVRTFEGHATHICSISQSADGRWALSGGDDKTLRLWEVATGRCVRTFEGHTSYVNSVILSGNGRWAVSGSSDHTLRLWDLGDLVTVRRSHESPARLSAVKSTKEAMESAGLFERLMVGAQAALQGGRYAEARQILSKARSIPGYERHMQALQAWNTLPRGCSQSDFRAAWCVHTFEGHTGGVKSVCLSADARWALSGSLDKTLRLWDVVTRRCVRTFEGHTGYVNSVSLSKDRCWALSGSDDNTLRLWDVTRGRCVRTFEGHTASVSSVCLSGDARWAFSGSLDKLRMWDVATGRCVRTFEGHSGYVYSISLSRDGRRLLSGCHCDYMLRLWDVATGRCVQKFGGDETSPNRVNLSGDGRWALSGAGDKKLRLWEVAKEQDSETFSGHRIFEGHTDKVNSVNLSIDGRWILSGGDDKTLRLWAAATGRCLHMFEGHTDKVNSVSLSTDGLWALSGSSDNTLRLWQLDWEYAPLSPTSPEAK